MTARTINEYHAEINRRACALIDSGDLDAITAQMSQDEAECYRNNIRVVCVCKLDKSREHAINEIRAIITAAAKKAAQVQFASEMHAGAQKHALDRYYAMAGVAA